MGSNLSFHELLGSGASGDVYRVTWKSKEHGTIEAATKKVKIEGEVTVQIQREIEFLKKLDHRNIIKYYDTIIAKEHVLIITEYAAGGSLFNYLQNRTSLSEHLVHLWTYYLASGIEYLKQNKLVHRDLKSPNCLVTADSVLKICDFGIAKHLSGTKTTRSTKGSVRWQAPEIFQDQQLSPKADLFAVAIIVWEMTSCEEPYRGMRQEHIIYKVTVDELRPAIPQNCSPFLRGLMEQCWQGDRDKRPDIEEVVDRVKREFIRNLTEAEGLTWNLKYDIHSVGELCFVDVDRLAICSVHHVEIHQMTREETLLVCNMTCDEWKGRVMPCGLAACGSDGVLVICKGKPFVYHFSYHEPAKYVNKYQIRETYDGDDDDQRMSAMCNLTCIAANDSTVVVGVEDLRLLMVCSLPEFSEQMIVKLSLIPHDLSFITNYVLVMGDEEMLVKPLGNMNQDLFRIQPPDGWRFRSVAFRDDERQIYAACYHWDSRKGCVCKYTWGGDNTPRYVNTDCDFDNLNEVWYKRLSVTDGLLAVSDTSSKVFSLE